MFVLVAGGMTSADLALPAGTPLWRREEFSLSAWYGVSLTQTELSSSAPAVAHRIRRESCCQWISERFSMTRLRDWRRSSLQWEAAWLREPQGVAADVGMSVVTLDERPTDERTVLDALSSKLASTSQDDEVVGGLTGKEIVETIVLMLRRDDLDGARALARSARDASPRNVRLGGALAFCTIPADPVDARRMIEEIMPTGGVERPILLANAVSTYLADGDASAVGSLLSELEGCCGEAEGWLWEPASLWRRDERPVLRSMSVKKWVDQVRDLVV